MTREEHLKTLWNDAEKRCTECAYSWEFLFQELPHCGNCGNLERKASIKRLMEKACITNI